MPPINNNQTGSPLQKAEEESYLENLIKLAEHLITSENGNQLSCFQKVILREVLSESSKTYTEIAKENNYSESYLKQGIAPKLWQQLSVALGEKVSKHNCRTLLKQRLNNLSNQHNSPLRNSLKSKNKNLEFPEGQTPLYSPFYIERYPQNNLAASNQSIEQICYQEIVQPRALIRITAPRKMGKTSLMARVLAYGNLENYYTVRLSLLRAGTGIFTSTEKFFRWFCANVGQQLKLKSKLDEYWDEDMGALVSSTIYFQGYLLEQITHPVILALDEVNRLFEYPELALDFFSLLRSWYEETKDNPTWQKLRLLISHSTEVYLPFHTNQSPFNVGLPIELPPFTKTNVKDLAHCHGLKLTASELEQLMGWTGGFPYLVRLALYHSLRNNIPLGNLLQKAATDTGIFSKYLHQILWTLQQNPSLAEEFQRVLKEPTQLSTEHCFKLRSLGLVHLQDNQARVSCQLYQQYFEDKFRSRD
ncbi:MAG: AAA-like domain-containing protein [Coleofasciculaceae cyanobacterium]